MTHYPEVGPTLQVFSARVNLEWQRPRVHHNGCGLKKSMDCAMGYLQSEGVKHGAVLGGVSGHGFVGWER